MLSVLSVGRVVRTESRQEPVRVLDAAGQVRFLAAVDVGWDRAGPEDVRDFILWMRVGQKMTGNKQTRRLTSATVNPISGKTSPGQRYSAATINHAESVVHDFYKFHLHSGLGPVVNPVIRSRDGIRRHAHHNPLDPFRHGHRGVYRQKLPRLVPRGLSDAQFDDMFKAMRSDRDRAMLAFYISSGVRASELLSMTGDAVDPGDQLIRVRSKGTRALQWVPAAAEAFVWLRLYQGQVGVAAPDEPLWVTLRRPRRPVTYDAMRAEIKRANATLGADYVLAAIVRRVRGSANAVPLVPRWDGYECELCQPLPYLFQWRHGNEDRVISVEYARAILNRAAAQADIRVTDAEPLRFRPHDFRRIFATDAQASGLPVRIIAALLGHKSLATTQIYTAIYPEDVIRHHRGFISRRRQLRPGEEYREPTDQEWEEFEAHFVRRKVSLGTCGRANGSGCQHEHACVRCSLLRTDPAQIGRLREIITNLSDRIAEANEQGWLGEAEGLQVSLGAARIKLDQMERQLDRRSDLVQLGFPVPGHRG